MQKIPFDLELYRQQIQPYLEGKENAHIFWKALDFAAVAHENQWRRTGDAYILHPCSVAKILVAEIEITDPEILAAALLHDTVEDVEEVTSQVIGKQFGGYVQAIVEGCTKVTKTSGDRQNQAKRTHRKIFSGAALRPEVMLVKLADRLHNLRTLRAMPKRKQQQVADETIDIYAPLANVFGLFNVKREMYNLALMYKFRRQWLKIDSQISRLKSDPMSLEIVSTLRKRMAEKGIEASVDLRVKDLWAYYDYTNRLLLHEIDFPCEIHILVNDASTCYDALGTLNMTYGPIPRTIRDFIANPKFTGYQSLHSRAIIGGHKYLFKIRTPEMARVAQRGIFRNWSSKTGKQQQVVKQIQELFDVIGSDISVSYRDVIADSSKKEIYTYTPKGDLIYLPIDSTVLDFAFRVHTDIGHTCLGALVNNKYREPGYVLKDGDVVNIRRAHDPLRFDPDILNICKLPRTRSELAKGFRKRSQTGKIVVGKETFLQEIRRYGIAEDVLADTRMQDVLRALSVKGLDDMYVAIGEGRLRLDLIISAIKGVLGLTNLREVPKGEEYNTIELCTLDPVLVKLSSCCKPLPTEKGNIALLNPERLSIHRRDCTRFEAEMALQREYVVNVLWNVKTTKIRKPQTLVIHGAKRQRIMMVTGVAPSEMHLLELLMLSPVRKDAPDWQLTFEVANLAGLQAVLKHYQKAGIEFTFEIEY